MPGAKEEEAPAAPDAPVAAAAKVEAPAEPVGAALEAPAQPAEPTEAAEAAKSEAAADEAAGKAGDAADPQAAEAEAAEGAKEESKKEAEAAADAKDGEKEAAEAEDTPSDVAKDRKDEKDEKEAAGDKDEPKTPRRRGPGSTTPTAKKRGPGAGRKANKPVDDGEETESDNEKKPRKRAKTAAATPGPKKTPGRKKKTPVKVEESSDSEDEEQKEVERRVDALPSEIKAKFGEIVWAKMGGYPYWPSLITDPRLLPPKLQQTAMKDLENKYFLFFYTTNNFAAVLHKNVAAWGDTTNNYREGFPEKDAKAPKRREKLMSAIKLADEELLLPVDERVDGLLKPDKDDDDDDEEEDSETEPETPAEPKKRGGKAPAKTGAKRGRKPRAAAEQATPETTAEEDGEDAAETSTLSKEEIKAKVAVRKTPSRKKIGGTVDNAAKKTAKTPAKTTSKTGAASKTDIDTKRKKEIELVVPHKSVKSADIREATEEAAKRGRGDKLKRSKDKVEYKVGDLSTFAKEMARLYAQESSKNNDELVFMLNKLLKEKVMYRSDVERSGTAAIIARLRKSSNPTVSTTASALRRHMIEILVDDTTITSSSAPTKTGKKHASDSDAGPKQKVKKQKVEGATEGSSPDASKAEGGKSEPESTKAEKGLKKDETPGTTEEKPVDTKTQDEKKDGATADAKKEENTTENAPQESVSSATESTNSDSNGSAVPVKEDDDVFKGETNLDKNREVFIEMLGGVLKANGPAYEKLSKEIEGLVFDRYKESNGDYRSQARLVIFGLKGNAKLRERLFAGTLHGLEIAYASDEFFKSTE